MLYEVITPLNFVGRNIVKAVLHSIEKNDGFIGASYIEEENKSDFFQSKIHKTGTLLKILNVITSYSIHYTKLYEASV